MGIHIGPNRVTLDPFTVKRLPRERFDGLRYSGDREFMRWIYDHCEKLKEPLEAEDQYGLYRPDDFCAARAWVNAEVVEGNRQRLLNLLDMLEAEPDLWMDASY